MYLVKFIEEADLPAEHAWALVFHDEGGATLYVKRSAVCERVLAQAWVASVRHHRRRFMLESRQLGRLVHERSG